MTLKSLTQLYLQTQLLEAQFEGISFLDYLRYRRPGREANDTNRQRLKASLLYIHDLRRYHPERESKS